MPLGWSPKPVHGKLSLGPLCRMGGWDDINLCMLASMAIVDIVAWIVRRSNGPLLYAIVIASSL